MLRKLLACAAQLLLCIVRDAAGLPSFAHSNTQSARSGSLAEVPMPQNPSKAAQVMLKYFSCYSGEEANACARELTADDAVMSIECTGSHPANQYGLTHCGTFNGKDMLADYFEAWNSNFECPEEVPLAIFQGPPGTAAISWRSTVKLRKTGKVADKAVFGVCTLDINDDALVSAIRCMYDHTSEIELMHDAARRKPLDTPEVRAVKKMNECLGRKDWDCLREMTSSECQGVEHCGGSDLRNLLPYCQTFKGRDCLTGYFDAWTRDFELVDFDAKDYYQGAAGEVAMTWTGRLQDRDSGEETEQLWGVAVNKISKDGQIVGWQCTHDHHAEATLMEKRQHNEPEDVPIQA